MAQDVRHLRLALMPNLPPEEAQVIYSPTSFNEPEDFKEFCKQLNEDAEFRLLVVSNVFLNLGAEYIFVLISEKIPYSPFSNWGYWQHSEEYCEMPHDRRSMCSLQYHGNPWL
jgi:hypothetical protein